MNLSYFDNRVNNYFFKLYDFNPKTKQNGNVGAQFIVLLQHNYNQSNLSLSLFTLILYRCRS